MKKTVILSFILLTVCAAGGCSANLTEQYTVAAQPYRAFTEENVQSSECRIELGDEVFVSGQGAWFSNNGITISEGGVYTITGEFGGSISVTTADPVKLTFENASIVNTDGYAVDSRSERLVISSDGGSSVLSGSGGDFRTAVHSGGTVLFAGEGGLELNGGVYSSGNIQFGRGVSVFCEILRAQGGFIIPGSFSINR